MQPRLKSDTPPMNGENPSSKGLFLEGEGIRVDGEARNPAAEDSPLIAGELRLAVEQGT